MPINNFIEKIKKYGKLKEFSSEEVIILQGEEGDKVYFLIDGKVKISIFTESGDEIILAILTPPNFFGEMALFNNTGRSANVISLTNCKVIEVKKEDFLNFIKENVELTYLLLIEIINRLRLANKKIYLLTLTRAEDKLKFYLKEKIAKNLKEKKDTYLIELPTHSDIGKELGLTRETVTKVLNKFYKEKLISGTKGKIKILKDFFSLI